MYEQHRVVTPENVEFVYEVAGLASRLSAVLIDHLILLAGVIAVVLGMVFAGGASFGFSPFIALAVIFLLYFGYFAGFEWRRQGQTPGKKLAGIRVIDDRGLNPDLFQAILRNLVRTIDMMPLLFSLDFVAFGMYGLGGGVALAGARGKRLGDWAAGTMVVRVRTAVRPAAIVAPGDKYNSLQEDASVRRRIRTTLGLEEREVLLQLCLRRHELDFESRQRLFAQASTYLERRLELPRDSFLSEEKFVQNVAAIALAEDRQFPGFAPASLSGVAAR